MKPVLVERNAKDCEEHHGFESNDPPDKSKLQVGAEGVGRHASLGVQRVVCVFRETRRLHPPLHGTHTTIKQQHVHAQDITIKAIV